MPRVRRQRRRGKCGDGGPRPSQGADPREEHATESVERLIVDRPPKGHCQGPPRPRDRRPSREDPRERAAAEDWLDPLRPRRITRVANPSRRDREHELPSKWSEPPTPKRTARPPLHPRWRRPPSALELHREELRRARDRRETGRRRRSARPAGQWLDENPATHRRDGEQGSDEPRADENKERARRSVGAERDARQPGRRTTDQRDPSQCAPSARSVRAALPSPRG